MADIFVSYGRDDKQVAENFAARVETLGLSVFIDRHIESGSNWEQRLQGELDAARLIVVLWSPRSIGRDFVLREARSGKESGRLAPVLIEDCDIPAEFSAVQAHSLAGWTGAPADPRLLVLFAQLAARLEDAPAPRAASRIGSASAPTRRERVSSNFDMTPVRRIVGLSRLSWAPVAVAGLQQFLAMALFTAWAFLSAADGGSLKDLAFPQAGGPDSPKEFNPYGLAGGVIMPLVLAAMVWFVAYFGATVVVAVLAAIAAWILSLIQPYRFQPVPWLNRQIVVAARASGQAVEHVLAANVEFAEQAGWRVELANSGRQVKSVAPLDDFDEPYQPPTIWRRGWVLPWIIIVGLICLLMGGYLS
jgi:hypothetical protein